MLPCGLINLNKPDGMSSRQAVNPVQRLARPAKAGHAGTLDPLATGVLVVCVGGATRLIEYVQRMPKQYVGTFLLGRQSVTEDIEGEVIELPDQPEPTLAQIEAAAQRLVGQIEQRPPVFSALKVHGRPAYKLARQGKSVELAARPITIYRIAVRSYEYPELSLEIDCGSGTYVRSLGRDLAASLGTSAVMSGLVRTRIGGFCIEDAIDPGVLTLDNWLCHVQPPLRAVEYLPRMQLSAADTERIRNGLTIERTGGEDAVDGLEGAAEVAAIGPDGQLIGLLTPIVGGGWRTLRNLPTGG
jgi:tRNA pseudouridine55 synthase